MDFVIPILSFVLSVVTAFLLEKKFIPFLMRIKMGQTILEIGPRWHKSKEGTPTMGGLFIMGAVLISFLAFVLPGAVSRGNFSLIIVFIMALLYGAIGFIDDYVKFVKKRNKGLTVMQKLVLQFAVAAAFLFAMKSGGYITTTIALPFCGIILELGIFYYIFSIIFIVLVVNSVNLTDGIDGLASSVTLIVSLLFGAVSYVAARVSGADTMGGVAFFAAVMGALVGFLIYNYHPARIFMGDTGSLFLGGVVVGASYYFDCPLIILIAGLIYIIEAASVVIQVGFFKLTKKRIFKMAPIHHHFEMSSWSEVKIVRVFTAFTAVMCILAYAAFRF